MPRLTAIWLLIVWLLAGCSPTTGGHTTTAPAARNAVGPAGAAPVSPTASSATPIRFTDITAQAGIDFSHHNFSTPAKYMIETMGSGCAFIDYDNDGYPDILLLNERPLPGSTDKTPATLKLYHNNHDNTFTDVTHQSGLDRQPMYAMGVAVGDYDNDGRDDIYISCVLGPGHLFHNEGGGRFRDVTREAGVGNEGHWGTSCAWADYDRDGKLDLFVCNYVKYRTLQDDQPCYAGEQQRIYCIPVAYEATSCTLFHNDGHGHFTDVTRRAGIDKARGKSLGVAVWDLDGKGYPDLFVANDTMPGFLLRNQGNGTYKEIGTASGVAYDEEGNSHSGMGIDVDDANNDSRIQVVITNYQGQQTSLYQQTEPELFQDIHRAANLATETGKILGFGSLFCDYDNDGYKDILQVNGHVQNDIEQRELQTRYMQPTLLFRNQHDGTYQEVGLRSGAPFNKPIVGRGCAWGDIDNDGRQDLLITANNGRAMLWRNETPTANHWLMLRLEGVRSNRDGIGAQVRVTAGGITRRTQVRSGSSYLSQSDLRAHFGLGEAKKADVEIRWPSGAVDRIASVSCDHIYRVREGTGKVE